METPPRAWGRLFRVSFSPPTLRNTPTGVGKTHSRPAAGQEPQKHPHGRGEDGIYLYLVDADVETPPRAWGRLMGPFG
jgi:hypothetical protein